MNYRVSASFQAGIQTIQHMHSHEYTFDNVSSCHMNRQQQLWNFCLYEAVGTEKMIQLQHYLDLSGTQHFQTDDAGRQKQIQNGFNGS